MLPTAYKRVLAIRDVRLPLAGATVGRLPFASEALAMVLLVQGATGSFADAGLVNACYSIAAAVALPVQGRIIDRVGQTRVIVVATAVNALALVAMVVLADRDAGVAMMAAAGVAAGLGVPPLGTAIRTLWSALVRDPALRQSAFALDAVMVEVAFIVGPMLIAVIIAIESPAAAMLVNVGLALIGSTLFAVSRASREWRGGEPHGLGLAGPLRATGVRVLMGAGVGLGMCVGAIELGMIALATDEGARALGGALVAAQAAGSMLGGLWYGAQSWRNPAVNRLVALAAVLPLATAPLVASPSLAFAFPLMALSGIALAPTVSVFYALLDEVAPPGTATEATGWVLMAFVSGASLGTALAGLAVSSSGPHAGLAIGLAGAVVTALVSWLGRPRLVTQPSAAPA
jgi:MFS family permease